VDDNAHSQATKTAKGPGSKADRSRERANGAVSHHHLTTSATPGLRASRREYHLATPKMRRCSPYRGNGFVEVVFCGFKLERKSGHPF
jgi:hypothetical protein